MDAREQDVQLILAKKHHLDGDFWMTVIRRHWLLWNPGPKSVS